MIQFFIIFAFAGTMILIFYITIEVNKIEKSVHELVGRIREHYALNQDKQVKTAADTQ